jgi:hypothetical protein
MKIMRTLFIAFLVILLTVSVLAHLYMDAFLDKSIYSAIDFTSKSLAEKGVEIRKPYFSKAFISFPPAISAKGISSQIIFKSQEAFRSNRNFSFTIDTLTVSLESLDERKFLATIDGLVIRLYPEGGAPDKTPVEPDNCDRLDIVRLQMPFLIDFFNTDKALSQARSLVMELARFAKYGITDLEVSISGVSTFMVGGKTFKGQFLFVPHGEGRKLVMDPDDFRVIAAMSEESLTRDELAVYANNPLRMPQMFRIRNYASNKAQELLRNVSSLDEDAYRHILWAYLLTKAYGEKFSAEVTDAHEIDPAGKSEPDVRAYLTEELGEKEQKGLARHALNERARAAARMDLINNLIGREYARKEYPESSLLDRMLSDPRVVRKEPGTVPDGTVRAAEGQ